MRVLIIEDEDSVRSSLADLLTISGFTVIDAENGTNGLQKAFAQQPDCVICDIMMPDLSGYDVITVLRAHPKTANTCIIGLSAKAEASAKLKAISLGANQYITKPYKSAELVESIQKSKSASNQYLSAPDALSRISVIHEIVKEKRAGIYHSILWEYADQMIATIREQLGQAGAQS